MLWLAIRFPNLPVEIFLQGNREAPPLVVRDQHHVRFVSDTARACGIRPGLKLASAQALCDTLRIVERASDREARRLQRLAISQLNITPSVCIEPPDGLLLDIHGSLKLFRGLSPLLHLAESQLGATGLSWSLGLGHTPLSAWLLTNSERGADPSLPQDAKDIVRRLEKFPLSLLPLPARQREALRAPGFRTLGDVLCLPRSALGKRFGRSFPDWLQRLLGEKPDLRQPVEAPETFSAEVEFLDPVCQADGLLFPARRLVEELEHFLARRQQYTRAIHWHFLDNQGQSHALEIRRSGTDGREGVWQELTRRRFEQYQLPAPALKLSLGCESPLARSVASRGLFRDPEARPDRTVLLDRLATLPDLSLSLIVQDNHHLPERSQRSLHPLRARGSGEVFPDKALDDQPLWLLERPAPLQWRERQLYWRGTPLEVLPGEKRFSCDWWQQPVLRHYRVARHPLGLCCWVFHDPTGDRWFLHGFF